MLEMGLGFLIVGTIPCHECFKEQTFHDACATTTISAGFIPSDGDFLAVLWILKYVLNQCCFSCTEESSEDDHWYLNQWQC